MKLETRVIIGLGLYGVGLGMIGFGCGLATAEKGKISKEEHDKEIKKHEKIQQDLTEKMMKITQKNSKEQEELEKIRHNKENLENDIAAIKDGMKEDGQTMFMLRMLEENRKVLGESKMEYNKLYGIMAKNYAYTATLNEGMKELREAAGVKIKNSGSWGVQDINVRLL